MMQGSCRHRANRAFAMSKRSPVWHGGLPGGSNAFQAAGSSSVACTGVMSRHIRRAMPPSPIASQSPAKPRDSCRFRRGVSGLGTSARTGPSRSLTTTQANRRGCSSGGRSARSWSMSPVTRGSTWRRRSRPRSLARCRSWSRAPVRRTRESQSRRSSSADRRRCPCRTIRHFMTAIILREHSPGSTKYKQLVNHGK